MSVLLSRAPKPLQNAIHQIQTEDRYRYFPLYSVLLMLTIWGFYDWPITDKLITIYREYRWVLVFQRIAEAAVLALSLLLGFIGLLRRGWLPKLLSAYAIYHSGPMFLWNFGQYFWWNWYGLWMDFTWYAFDVPIAWIHRHVGEDGYVRTSLYAVYLLALYLSLRPLVKMLANRLWPIILDIEDRLIDRYPVIEKWRKPAL